MPRILTPRELWDDAIPLEDSWWAFGRVGDKRAYKQAGARLSKGGPADSTDEGWAQLHRTFTAWTEGNSIVRRMKSDLLDRIVDKELSAIGFQVEPSSAAEPSVISYDLFDKGVVDERAGTIANRGLKFASVRIVRASALPQRDRSPTIAIPKIGAPSWVDVRARAIDLAASREEKFYDIPRKEAVRLVQSALNEIRPGWQSARGFSDKSIEADIIERIKSKRLILPS